MAGFLGEFKKDKYYSELEGTPFRRWHVLKIDCHLPNAPCCYALYVFGELIYIGSTDNIRKRMSGHRSDHSEWFGFPVVLKVRFPKRFGEWAMTEIRLIRRLKPRLNKLGVNTRL